METAICLTAAVIGAAWIAGQAYAVRRRQHRTDELLTAVAADLNRLDREAERYARIIVSLHAAQHADHREIAIDRIRIDRLDRARACWPGPRAEAN